MAQTHSQIIPAARSRGRRRSQGSARQSARDALLHAAIQQFATHGYDGVSLRQIALQADVDAAMVVHGFGSKERLWEATIDHLAEELVQELSRTVDDMQPELDPPSQFSAVIAHLARFLCARPLLSAFVLREVALENSRSAYSYRRLVLPMRDMLRPFILACLGDDDDRPNADIVFTMVTGALVTTIVARPLVERMGNSPFAEGNFLRDLQAILPMFFIRR